MRALAAAIRSNTPVLLWGDPGVGKTAVVSSNGEKWGYHVETVIGSIREASDFMGLPIEVDGEVKYAAPAWAHRLAVADKGLLFLDELTTAPPSVQRAMLRILQEREVGELTLPDSVALVAAANPPSIAVDGWDLAAPVANRLMHLDWVFDTDAWIDGFVTDFEHVDIPTIDSMLGGGTDADKAQAKASIVSFLRTRPDFRLKVPTDPALAGKGWPSPRSWTNAAAVLSELDRSDSDAMTLVLTGCVGEAAAIEYIAWVVATDLYDPEEVLADPSIVNWTDRPDRIFALTSALTAIARMRGDKRTWTGAMTALTACAAAGRPDLAYPGARTLLQKLPADAKLPTGTVEAFGDLLQKTGKWEAKAA